MQKRHEKGNKACRHTSSAPPQQRNNAISDACVSWSWTRSAATAKTGQASQLKSEHEVVSTYLPRHRRMSDPFTAVPLPRVGPLQVI